MTTTGNVAVFGILTNPTLSHRQVVPSSQTVQEAVDSLWKSIGEQVDKDFTLETTKPSATVVLSGAIDPFTHVKVVNCVRQSQP
jgi:hypothetical protein